ncbi:MAG: mannitol dehydrogenase family protein [Pseudoruegeria sp.]
MDELIPLSNAVLDKLTIEHPTYDRANLRAGMVHIGVGNFHRSHQAWYLHRLMQAGKAHDWAIVGAGVRPYDAAMRERLLKQDCLTTLIELDPETSSAEVIGSMIDYLPIEANNAPLILAMADPAIRIVSMTVTEGGYYLDPVTKAFDAAHPDIQHDITNPGAPCTAFGAIVAAMRLRRAAGHGPFTGLSCDNLQGNGDILKQAVVSLARLTDSDLADWIEENGAFPNSMVDCIAPATGPNEHQIVRDLGIEDAAPVTHEPFRQWVIEDNFCDGRPDWSLVGATFTSDVHSYETMKLRILNAGHQVLANVGEIVGIETISECMADPLIYEFFGKVQSEEIATTVEAVPGRTPQSYVELIKGRFSNPRIVDTTRRVAFDGSSRHPGFVLPILRDQLDAGGSVSGLALVEAFWARMCEGTRENGTVIEANDPFWQEINTVAKEAKENPSVWLAQSQFYGDLENQSAFADAFSCWLTLIWDEGSQAAMRKYTS